MYAMRRQKGLTLIEIMIGLLVGAIISAGVITVFNNTLQSNNSNLNLTHINQDLRGMMDIMVRDIRRAGYVTDQPANNDNLPAGNVDGINDDLTNNPFTDSTIPGATTDITVIGGDCILYTPITINIYTTFPKNCCAVAFKASSSYGNNLCATQS